MRIICKLLIATQLSADRDRHCQNWRLSLPNTGQVVLPPSQLSTLSFSFFSAHHCHYCSNALLQLCKSQAFVPCRPLAMTTHRPKLLCLCLTFWHISAQSSRDLFHLPRQREYVDHRYLFCLSYFLPSDNFLTDRQSGRSFMLWLFTFYFYISFPFSLPFFAFSLHCLPLRLRCANAFWQVTFKFTFALAHLSKIY